MAVFDNLVRAFCCAHTYARHVVRLVCVFPLGNRCYIGIGAATLFASHVAHIISLNI
jgi:hypothetical protein